MLHDLYFISDILVVSYVLSCDEPAEIDSNRACRAMHRTDPRVLRRAFIAPELRPRERVRTCCLAPL